MVFVVYDEVRVIFSLFISPSQKERRIRHYFKSVLSRTAPLSAEVAK